jgi:hypothetical protein
MGGRPTHLILYLREYRAYMVEGCMDVRQDSNQGGIFPELSDPLWWVEISVTVCQQHNIISQKT